MCGTTGEPNSEQEGARVGLVGRVLGSLDGGRRDALHVVRSVGEHPARMHGFGMCPRGGLAGLIAGKRPSGAIGLPSSLVEMLPLGERSHHVLAELAHIASCRAEEPLVGAAHVKRRDEGGNTTDHAGIPLVDVAVEMRVALE